MIDKCIECESNKFSEVKRDIVLESGNPNLLIINSECTECKVCGKKYFNDRQVLKLSDKVENIAKH